MLVGSLAHELQLLEISQTPGTHHEMQPYLDPLAQWELSIHSLRNHARYFLTGGQAMGQPIYQPFFYSHIVGCLYVGRYH
jgi:hypothetical protein